MDLSIIIVSWNVKEKLRANLKALLSSSVNFNFEIFVVDNNSVDRSVEMVRTNFPSVHLLVNSDNLGFARANNQAIKQAQGQFILLLNPDMCVQPDTLENILKWAQENKEATVIGCHLITEKNETIKQVRRFPQLWDQLLIALKIPHFIPSSINRYLYADFDYNVAAKVDSIRGAFFLINRKNFKKISGSDFPLLDERYFIWFEEVDFCRQVYKLGGEVWYTPIAHCLDYVGSSFNQVKRGKTQEYFSESMLKYFKKWEAGWKFFVLKIIWGIIRLFV